MFTMKEIRIIKTLVEEEMKNLNDVGGASKDGLLDQYEDTLSGIMYQLDAMQNLSTTFYRKVKLFQYN